MSDANQDFLRQLVTQVLANPKDFADLFRRADWPSIFDAVGLPQTKVSAAAPTGPSAILSTLGRIQRDAMARADGGSRAGWLRKDVAAQPPNVHTEADAADTIRLAGFDPNQSRDSLGRWTKEGSSVAPSAVTGLMDVVDPIEGPANQELQKAKDESEQKFKDRLEELKKAIKEASEGPKTAFKKGWKSTQQFNTRKNVAILRKNMGGKLPPGEQGHHIVQGIDNNAYKARRLLDDYQIDINGKENGVSLTPYEHQQSWLQRRETIKLVTDRLQNAAKTSGDWDAKRQSVIKELGELAKEIKAGKFPPGNPRFMLIED